MGQMTNYDKDFVKGFQRWEHIEFCLFVLFVSIVCVIFCVSFVVIHERGV